MTGLIDCNNFFVSCERIFNPAVRNKPVIVFSNNDGCAVALSNEAKALGIKRGDPYFKIKGFCKVHDIKVFSGNHKLYSDISSRVMSTLSSIIPDIEIYSIDEAFIPMDGIDGNELYNTGRSIVRRIRRDTGIPTSLGIAPTKTLAKVAARFAKKYPAYHSCCVIDNEEKRRKALALTPVKDVWGIGRKLSLKLNDYGITTALQIADLPKDSIDKLMNVTGEKTWRELNGLPCIDHESDDMLQKQMMCSRTFAKSLTEFEDISNAIASFTNIVGRKMRERSLCAVSVSVFLHTDGFRTDLPQYYNTAHRTLPEPTSDTMTLTTVTVEAARSIFRKGYAYKKAGVMINELTDSDYIQQSLFCNPENRKRRQRLMEIVDNINSGVTGHDKIHTGSYSPMDTYIRRENSSRLFSTRLSDIITINCNYGT